MHDPRGRGDRRDPRNAQDAPGAIFSRGVATPVSPLFATRIGPEVISAIEHFRDVEDDADAATPVDAQNAPTGVWKSRKEHEIPTAPTSIICFSDEEEERRTTQINCPPNRIKSRRRSQHRTATVVQPRSREVAEVSRSILSGA